MKKKCSWFLVQHIDTLLIKIISTPKNILVICLFPLNKEKGKHIFPLEHTQARIKRAEK